MTYELTDILLKEVLKNNPGINEFEIEDCMALNEYDLLIVFRNGHRVLFDTYSKTSRRIYHSEFGYSDEQIKKEFKDRLIVMMDRKNINEEKLAKKVGTTQPMISRYISGKSLPNIITAKKIANALGCSLDDFFYKHI